LYKNGDEGITHGTRVFKELVLPWARTGRLFKAEYYFASIANAEELYLLSLRFTRVVQTASRRFPMKELASTELSNREDGWCLQTLDADGKPWILAFVWRNRERR
jgi:hypothetical protein